MAAVVEPCFSHELLEVADVVEAHEVDDMSASDLGDAHRHDALGAVRMLLVGAAQRDLVPAPVVAVGRHDDVVPAGEGAGHAHRHHDGLEAELVKRTQVDGRGARAQPLGELALQSDRSRDRRRSAPASPCA